MATLQKTTWLIVACLALLGQACELSDCPRFPPSEGDDTEYDPRSAPTKLFDADSGKAICLEEDQANPIRVDYAWMGGDAGADTKQFLYPYEDPDDCMYQFPGWQWVAEGSDAVLTVPGYEPLAIEIDETEKDACGVPTVPELLEFELTKTPPMP